MRAQIFRTFGFAIVMAATVSFPARAQISDLGKIIAKKDKDAADAVDKAGKSGSTKSRVITPTASPAKPPSPKTGEYNPDTEDPMSVLDISPENLARFSAGVAAETHKRDESGGRLTAAQYEASAAATAQMTTRQYQVLKQRVTPFCQSIAKGKDRPDDGRLAYMPAEAETLTPKCTSLLPALNAISAQARMAPSPQPTKPKTTGKKRIRQAP